MGYLLWARGPDFERAAILRAGQAVRVGRDRANDLCISVLTAARRHLEVTLDGEFARVRNVSKSTGFRVNDVRCSYEATVRPGDILRVAKVQLWLEEPPAIDPAWLARDGGTVPRIAGAMLDRQDLRALPTLADALEGAGCSNARLLGGLRGQALPVWQQWVLELLAERL
jgi:hypothetical protein